jgi:hypothetical protein
MRQFIRHLAAALLAALILAVPAQAQTEVKDAPDPYVHRVAGVRFPEALPGFSRGRVFEYDEQGADASVGYHPQAMPGALTVYVYPSLGKPCDFWFEDADRAVMERDGVSREAGAAALRLLPASEPQQYSTGYSIAANSSGYDHPPLASYLWVGCAAGSDWVVKYRGTFDAADQAKAAALAEQLFAAIDWTPVTGG